WEKMYPEKSLAYRLIESAVVAGHGKHLDNSQCAFNAPALTDVIVTRIRNCFREHGAGTAIIGDSHGIDLFNGMYFRHKEGLLFGLTKGACRIHGSASDCDYDGFFRLLVREPKLFKTVLYTQAGFHLLEKDEGGRVEL